MSEMLILVKQLLISTNVTVSKKLTFEKRPGLLSLWLLVDVWAKHLSCRFSQLASLSLLAPGKLLWINFSTTGETRGAGGGERKIN